LLSKISKKSIIVIENNESGNECTNFIYGLKFSSLKYPIDLYKDVNANTHNSGWLIIDPSG